MTPPAAQPQRTVSRLRGLTAPLLIVVAVAAMWWQSRVVHFPFDPAVLNNGGSHGAALSGEWFGHVTYPSGAAYNERFMFHAERAALYGTASILGVGRGIEEGRIEGDGIYFSVRYQETAGALTVERRNRYAGALAGGELLMRLQDDKGNPPVDFRLAKSAAAAR